MNEKKIEPTDAMVRDVECWRSFTGTADRTPLHPILRAALNHYDAPGLFECDYTDYVHVDEAATRVEAAREQGWDDAAQHIYNKGWEGVTALRKANPYRPTQELPTNKGTVIVPADGREYIEANLYGMNLRAREAVLEKHGMTEEEYQKLPPEERKLIDAEIAEAVEFAEAGTWEDGADLTKDVLTPAGGQTR